MLIKILLVVVLFLSGCNSSISSSNDSESENKKESVEGEVISVSENSLLISYEQTLATVSLNDSDHSFSIGNIVKVNYEEIQETYPVTLTDPDIELKEIGDNRIEMIFNVICEIYEIDPGLNSEINFIALNLTEFDFLNESQKNALCYLVESKFKFTVQQATMEELIEQGLAEEMLIPEGILFTFKCDDFNSKELKFTCAKYRSGLGAIFFSESKAKLKNHIWNYELGGFSIS